MFTKSVLPNSLRLVTSRVQGSSVSIGIFIAAGSRYEGEREWGIAHFIEHMLFKGTEKRRTAQEISEAIEGVGGIINAGTDKELAVYWCKLLREHFDLAIDVLLDLLFHPRFDPIGIEKEKLVVIEEINHTLDIPQERVQLLLDEIMLPNHPLGRDVAGCKETVLAFKREDLLNFMRKHYLPQEAVIAIAGDIEHREAKERIEPLVSSWQQMPASPCLPAPEPVSGPQIKVEERDTEQVNLCLGFPGLPYAHPNRFSLDLLNIILGAGMSSRLFREIREKRGLAYQIQSSPLYYRDTGCLVIFAGLDKNRLSEALSAIWGELVKIREGVREEELRRAQEFFKGRMYLRLEDTRNIIGWLGIQEIMEGQILTPKQTEEIIFKITPKDLQEVAEKIISRDRLSLAAVGPISANAISI